MTRYHAVMLDECSNEFGVDVTANSRDEAYADLADSYPESSVIQLESPQDTADRQKRIYDSLWADEEQFDPETGEYI